MHLTIAPPFARAFRGAPIIALALAMTGTGLNAQSDIDTFERGNYTCELPASEHEARAIEQVDESFRIKSASRYSSPQGAGTYLRRGDLLTMTSGPRNGDSYRIIGRGFLRKIDANGEAGRLRCFRQGR